MKRGIPAGIYNFMVEYGFVALLVLAAWSWIKANSLYWGLAVFILGFLFLTVGLPVLDHGLRKNRGGKRTRDSRVRQILAQAAMGLGVLLFLFVLISSGDALLAGASFFLVLVLVLGCVMVYRRRKNKKLLESGLDIVDEMSGESFEDFLLEHFKKMGYQGKLTPLSGDYGADLILHGDNETVAVQVKRAKGNVGIRAVQEAIGAVSYYKADRGKVITNSYFTPQAEKLAAADNVELWDRDWLVDVLSFQKGKETASLLAEKEDVKKLCPRCGYTMVVREGRRGRFWGCSKFPKCRYIDSLEG